MLEAPVWNLVFSSAAWQVCRFLLNTAKAMPGRRRAMLNLVLNKIPCVLVGVCCDEQKLSAKSAKCNPVADGLLPHSSWHQVLCCSSSSGQGLNGSWRQIF